MRVPAFAPAFDPGSHKVLLADRGISRPRQGQGLGASTCLRRFGGYEIRRVPDRKSSALCRSGTDEACEAWRYRQFIFVTGEVRGKAGKGGPWAEIP